LTTKLVAGENLGSVTYDHSVTPGVKMELFQNLFLLCLAVAVLWLHLRVNKAEERANKIAESSGNTAAPVQETKQIGRSTTAGR
jgi:hypothetical protein